MSPRFLFTSYTNLGNAVFSYKIMDKLGLPQGSSQCTETSGFKAKGTPFEHLL